MLPYSCIDSIMYGHEMRVYFSTQTQDEWGAVRRAWRFDRTERGTVRQPKQMMFSVGDINAWNEHLVGHSEEDLRIDSDGNLYAPTEVLVTFVNPKYIETAGPRQGLPTTFELRSSTPVEGPFGEVLHFDIQLSRSSDQDVTLDEA
jgi:hypothetical protein